MNSRLLTDFCHKMTIDRRYEGVLDYFQRTQPNPTTELTYHNAFEILVAVILSAQCTDKRVNMVTPALFAAYPTPQAMAAATVDDILQFVKSVSYPNSKAQHLHDMAAMLVDEFHGVVPDTMEQLTRLPGVGRKTANVMLGLVFGKAAIAVDTHVFRVSHRLGLSDGKTVDAVEKDLESHIPESLRPKAHHWLILHGRYICTARNPKCASCELSSWCREYERNNRKI